MTEIPYGYCHCGCGLTTKVAKENNRKRGILKGEPFLYVRGHSSRNKVRSLSERFWSKVNKNGSIPKHCPELGACWEWTAAKSSSGYGKFCLDWKNKTFPNTQRVAWELTYGEIPDELWVLHKCDNRLCCNPNHLFLGTPQDNVDDMFAKGRFVKLIGEQKPAAKLTREKVLYVRDRFALGTISKSALAREMQVGTSTIVAVLSGRTWKHI